MDRGDPADVGPKDIFLQSLARCDRHADFAEQFYQRFMASSHVVREKFTATDFERQRRMLRRSLELTAAATVGDPEGLRELTERADTHSHLKLDIEPPLYDLWLEAAIATARASDPKWTAEVEAAWHTILSFAIRHMTVRY